jgi:hypothetical protein
MNRPLSIILITLVPFAAACASAGDSATDPTRSTGSNADTASTDALRVLGAGGTFAFSLDESGPSAAMHAKCKQDQPATADACYAAIAAAGAHEKIRFAPDGSGHVVFTSFGPDDDGRDVSWIDVPLVFTADGTNAAWGKPAGADRGTWAKTRPLPANAKLRFEVVDAKTVVMVDPKKGRLVFHKES